MKIGEKTFGELLVLLREQRKVTLRELAREIGISAPFLSDVEKGKRAALTADRIEKVVVALDLNSSEKTALYDAAGKQKNTIPPDLPNYIMEHKYVSTAIRAARDLDASEDDWNCFIDTLKNRRKGNQDQHLMTANE